MYASSCRAIVLFSLMYAKSYMAILLVVELNQLQGLSSALGPSKSSRPEVQGQGDDKPSGSDILDSDKYTMVLDKSNIVMLGPTGSGRLYSV